ncbi:tetratricopeptide repeat protein [Dyadobacter sp. CY312]|uniref:tetratricopeptide repeat-containing sensor histidine kinase n=1 Tax=Dyadobacter sp. CY312 TaxID=2907303 RepID=UPI001F181730|nr:tetratricopeptide repeat protein [Dyadobacter sp. CY312]MCE7038879.1 sensor histidine kinase [Dyadobacter sp. CY312]
MTTLYKLGILVVFSLLLTGLQCTSFDSKLTAVRDSEFNLTENRQADFEQDTVRIYECLALARSYLYKDAEKTMVNAKEVLKLAQKHQWNKGKILAYNLLSTFYLMDGSYDLLRELSNETLLLAQKEHLPLYVAHAKRFVAESYSEYRQWDSAKVNYEYALKVFIAMDDDSSKAVCLENMGTMHREQNQLKEAFECYDQAFSIYEKLKMPNGKASVLQNRGYLYVRGENHKDAEKQYLQALKLYQTTQNFYGELSLLNDLGNSYYWDGKYDKAIEACNRALVYSKKYNTTQQTNWAHQTLGRSYKAKSMLEQSIYHSENAYYYRRQIHDDYIRRQYTMYQLMYENEQMDSAIQKQIIDDQNQVQRVLIGFSCLIIAFAAFLWNNNKKLRRKNAEIQEAMIQGQTIERKRVAAELHDHLGGTLASLNWYLFGIDKKSLPEEEQKIYNRVHEMVGAAYKEVRSLSHNLMPAELEEHGLIMALGRLTSKLSENKNIQFTFDHNTQDKRYGNKTEFELYSIVLELANNIIKHSNATSASISLAETAKTIQLLVSDNGQGIDATSKQGIGLNNVKNRVQSLSGKIKISNQPEQGTLIDIEIPNTQRS